MGSTSAAYPSISQLNPPASTVLLFEIQGNHNNAGPGPNVTDVNETSSGSGNGSYIGIYNYKPDSDSGNAVYATGGIGGYPLNQISSSTRVHSDGSNYLATNGHVKWLRAVAVSGGGAAASPTTAEVHDSTGTANAARLPGRAA